MTPIPCKICQTEFTPIRGNHVYCSAECKGKAQYIYKRVTTKSQYAKISGNWSRFVCRLLYSSGRKRAGMTREFLLDLLEKQNYKCAISGEPLTCQLGEGVELLTNISIDQIKAGQGYHPENVQLVQKIFNIMKWNQDYPVFIENCRKAIKHHEEKESTRLQN